VLWRVAERFKRAEVFSTEAQAHLVAERAAHEESRRTPVWRGHVAPLEAEAAAMRAQFESTVAQHTLQVSPRSDWLPDTLPYSMYGMVWYGMVWYGRTRY
jgi:hypothetical protein